MKIDEKIILLRKQKGLSQEDLANQLDISRQAVYKWESGSATPDLVNIRKMAKLFDISFDNFLDDDLDLSNIKKEETIIVNKIVENNQPKKKEYRSVYNSNKKMYDHHAEIDHGYSSDRDKRNDESDLYFKVRISKMENILKEFGFYDYIRLQDDVAAAFFIDSKNCTFGFYYNGAIQFVCPFENYISSHFSNLGNEFSYGKQSVVGVGFGSDGINSVGVGSVPKLEVSKPITYYFTVTYFDNNEVKEFKLSLNCSRKYTVYEHGGERALILRDLTSDYTNKALNDIYTKLISFPTISEKIFNKEVIVKNIDINLLKEKNEHAVELEHKYLSKLIYESELIEKRRAKIRIIVVSIIGAIVAIIILSIIISTIVKDNKIKEKDKDVAQPVIQMIEQIGEVTLDDEYLLNRIGNSYSRLTTEQKRYVKNYQVYLDSKREYEELYLQYLNDKTSNDPTKDIVLSDLNGIWECGSYLAKIDDVNSRKSVMVYYYNKNTSSTPSISSLGAGSSELYDYDIYTQTKKGRLYDCSNKKYIDFAIKINNGDYELTFSGKLFKKINQS